MEDGYSAIERRIKTACEAARQQKKPNFAELARQHRVPVKRLRARFQGRNSRSDRTITTKRLTESQERGIIRWIELLDSLYVPPTAGVIESNANTMLRQNDPHAEPLGKNWVYRFIKQRLSEEFYWVKQKPADKNRIDAEDIGILRCFYDRLEMVIERTPPSQIYNFDETGFQLGQGQPQKVITRNQFRTRITANDGGELLTGIECVAADGWVMEPFFVAKGSTHLERWYDHEKLSDATMVALSGSGYSNDLLALKWLDHFDIESSVRKIKGIQRVLLFDGHGSHLTKEFLDTATSLNIHCICFPPHTTHLVQPLDGSPFRALKQAFRQKNNALSQWGYDAADKAVFFREIADTRAQSLRPRTIRKAFAERGIYPCDGQQVIGRIEAELGPDKDLYWPTGDTPPPPSSSIHGSPPATPYEAERVGKKLTKRLDQEKENVSPQLARDLNRVANHTSKLVDELAALRGTIQQQLPPRPTVARRTNRRRAGKWGTVYADYATRSIADRKQREEAVLRRKQEREAKEQAAPYIMGDLPDGWVD